MSTLIPYKDAPRILIVVSGGANYFYNAIGERLAEAFRNLGCHVDVRLLKTYQPAEYDLTLYVNLYENVTSLKARSICCTSTAITLTKLFSTIMKTGCPK